MRVNFKDGDQWAVSPIYRSEEMAVASRIRFRTHGDRHLPSMFLVNHERWFGVGLQEVVRLPRCYVEGNALMSSDSLIFNGTLLIWHGHGSFPATSGTKGHQQAKEQDLKDFGPIPEGKYSFKAVIAKGSCFADNGTPDHRQGIEELAPEGATTITTVGGLVGEATEFLQAWGHNRVRLNTLHIDHRKARNRSGFYIHDSHKGQTHGCIEVAHVFFDRLRAYAMHQQKLGSHAKTTLFVTVKYPSSDANTNGGTEF